jgi:Bacterial Ig domain
MKALTIAVLFWSIHAMAATLNATFSPIASGSNVDLSVVGKLDWVHWGLYTETSLDRKATVSPSIGDFTLMGDTNSFLAAYQFADNSNGYSWADGSPDEGVTNTTTGVWAYGTPVSLDSGFQIQVSADTSPRTLQVFVGAFDAKGKFTASLSDNSAPAFTNGPSGTVDNLGNGPGGVFTVNYAAGSPGQTLTVTWTLALARGLDANVTLQAAALTASGANNPPYVAVTNPMDGAAFVEPATLLLQADARDFDGTVTNVAFYEGTNKLGQTDAAPYQFTWAGVGRGDYSFTAVAVDDAGTASRSRPVQGFVYGAGGGQTNSVTDAPAALDLTAEGTADWTHWGLVTNTSFDHKEVAQQISNFTALGTNAVQQYSDNFTAFSWSDGTPTLSATDTTTGVFITGETNGFRLTAPADTSARRLKIYVGGYGVQGEFQSFLSDLSAQPYTDTSVSNAFGNSYVVYTIDYSAASPGQHLLVTYRSLYLFDRIYGNVTLQAATLQGGSSVALPVQITDPMLTGSGFVFSFLTQPNHDYVVQNADGLFATNWNTVTTLGGTGGAVIVTNQIAGSGQEFYRVQTR